MQRIEPEILGITKEDIQEVFTKALQNFKESKTRVIYLDASYIYNFHLDDFEIVRKFNILGRYDLNAVLEWHRILERWHDDQTVIIGDKTIKPIQICRSFDRVVNEGLEEIARTVVGSTEGGIVFRSIGDGTVPEVLPGNTSLAHEIDRIDVNNNKDGGSLSRDGSTIYSIGNHSKSVESASITECGMFTEATTANDKMFDHSVFATPVTHVQDSDAVGSTTVIYMCSG